MQRYMILSSTISALLLVGATAWADKAEKVHMGMVVSASADTLVMTDNSGKNEHAHKVDGAAAITIDGKPAKMPELVKGDKVSLTTGQDGQVVRIVVTRAKK